ALAAVRGAHLLQSRRDLADGRVPVDGLERAVGALTLRMEHPLAPAVLVMVEPERLLAGVSPGRRMRLVAPDLLEAAPIVATEPDQDAAVALAEDTGARFPLTRTLDLDFGAHRDLLGGIGTGWCSVEVSLG